MMSEPDASVHNHMSPSCLPAVFIVIPVGIVRALSTTPIILDEEDEEDTDALAEMAGAAVAAAGKGDGGKGEGKGDTRGREAGESAA
jgi:hypothetical protein